MVTSRPESLGFVLTLYATTPNWAFCGAAGMFTLAVTSVQAGWHSPDCIGSNRIAARATVQVGEGTWRVENLVDGPEVLIA